jgi:hypothetical protein
MIAIHEGSLALTVWDPYTASTSLKKRSSAESHRKTVEFVKHFVDSVQISRLSALSRDHNTAIVESQETSVTFFAMRT